jgi:hypothetical protein
MCASLFLLMSSHSHRDNKTFTNDFSICFRWDFRRRERIFRSFDSVLSQPGHTPVIDSNLLNYMGFNGLTQFEPL